jgi:hypothetical protein
LYPPGHQHALYAASVLVVGRPAESIASPRDLRLTVQVRFENLAGRDRCSRHIQ